MIEDNERIPDEVSSEDFISFLFGFLCSHILSQIT